MKRLIPLLLMLGAMAAAQAKVQVYPAPAGAALNDDFSVAVVQGGRTNDAPAWLVKVYDPTNAAHVQRSSMAQFSFDGEVEIRIRWHKGAIDSVRVRPLSRGIVPEVDGNEIRFRLSRPENLSVEVNGDLYHNLQLFACPLSEKPKKTDIYFGPGLHQLPGDSLRVPSGSTVYIAGGAFLKGRLVVDHAENVSISGRGIIDPGIREGIRIRHSRNVSVEGVVLSQLPVGSSTSVSIRNVKAISHFAWGDGFNVFASTHVSYDRCFARTSDDCTTVYATRKGYTGSSSDITMARSVLWADIAHPIFIGLHGNPAAPDTIQRCSYTDIDILGQCERQTDYQGCLAIAAGDLNTVRDIRFDDIRVEDIRCGQLVNIRTTWNRKYCAAPGNTVENITFRNVSYTGRQPSLSILAAYSPAHPVCNIRFQNLRINGLHIADTMPQKPKWYKTSDFANMYVGENVESITFE